MARYHSVLLSLLLSSLLLCDLAFGLTVSKKDEDSEPVAPLHVYRDASGKLVEEPESLPKDNTASAAADELDALYQDEVAVRTRRVRPLTRKALRASVVGSEQNQLSSSASSQSRQKHRRVISFNGV